MCQRIKHYLFAAYVHNENIVTRGKDKVVYLNQQPALIHVAAFQTAQEDR